MAGIAFDASADTMNGSDLQLFITDLILAFAKTCDINRTTETVDVTSKMSGAWKESVAGLMGWTISSECLTTNKTGSLSYDTLCDLQAAREPVSVKVAALGANNAPGTGFREGKAIITALDLKTDSGTKCTCSITLQGTGELKKSEVAAG